MKTGILAALAVCMTLALRAQTPISDPQAVALAQQSMLALTNGAVMTDITLQGTATELIGSAQSTDNVTFMAKNYGESHFDSESLDLHEIRTVDASMNPSGETIASGNASPLPVYNQWTDAAWFIPELSSVGATASPNVIARYIGQESFYGNSVQHLQFQRYMPGQTDFETNLIAQLSTMDVYLDATSFLPIAFRFNSHPNDDLSTNLPVEVDFSAYQQFGGLFVPTHVQKWLSGNLVLDITFTNVAVNAGLPDSDFAVQQNGGTQ
jgi:hypothetical protein